MTIDIRLLALVDSVKSAIEFNVCIADQALRYHDVVTYAI